MKRIITKALVLVVFALLSGLSQAQAQQKPNVLIIWGDDIGYWNVSAYNQGMMGYKTPNIDRIAREGALFTDWYGQQSCTAGRAAFITGQTPYRTGLLGGAYNNGLIQPFVNYNFAGGLYLTSAPILTVDWKADSGQRWTVPLGGGIGKIFHLGKLPVNTQLSAYYNVVHPDNGANWQLRAQVQFMFPK